MGRPIELQHGTFYEPKIRWRDGNAYARFYNPDKRPVQKDYALHTSDRTAAEALFHSVRIAYLHGQLDPWAPPRREGVTLEEAYEAYLRDQDVRPSSLQCKRVRLGPFVRDLPGMLVRGITAEHVRAYCYQPRFKTATQQRYLSELRQFCAYCEDRGWMSGNPASDVLKATSKRRRKQSRKLTEYLTPEEVRRITSAIEADAEARDSRKPRLVLVDIILFAVATGLRLGEICHLKWSDVRLYDPPKPVRGGLLYGWIGIRSEDGALTKTGDEDRVPVVPQAYDLLLKRLAERAEGDAYVFEAPRRGGQLNHWWVSHTFREYRRAVGIREEIHFHSLRHTCASWLAEAGVDLKVIQEVLRHANIRQTMRYAHLIPEAVASRMVDAFRGISLD